MGRVGDSPIIGAGLYTDESGAAVASGDRDRMLRFSIAFLVVERMKMGDSVNEACMHAMLRVAKEDRGCQAAVAAMDGKGNLGEAYTHLGFRVSYWKQGVGAEEVVIREAPSVETASWKHSCV